MLVGTMLLLLLVNSVAALGGSLWERPETKSGSVALVQRHAVAVMNREKVPPANFPVDVVYTWLAQPTEAEFQTLMTDCPHLHQGVMRVRDFDQLRFSLRMLDQNMPWIRNVFLVTDGKAPTWLNKENDKIKVINQTDLVPKDRLDIVLPIHNSQQVEAFIHRIPGLAEHFIYLNDDMFIGTKLPWLYFFKMSGKPLIYLDDEPVFELNWQNRTEPGSIMGRHMLYPLRVSMIEGIQAKWPDTFGNISAIHCRTNEMYLGPTWIYQWYGVQSEEMELSPYGGRHAFLHDQKARDGKQDPKAFTTRAREFYSYNLAHPPESGCINDNFAVEKEEFETQAHDLVDFMEKFSGGIPSQYELKNPASLDEKPKVVSLLSYKVDGKVKQIPSLTQP